MGLATALTVASKVAFIGWGMGWPDINFTGFSVHAMFSAAIYPVLAIIFVRNNASGPNKAAIALGLGIAAFVGYSRLVIGAHSVSEVAAGLLIGGAASTLALAWSAAPILLIRPLLPAPLVAWIVLTPMQLPASQTHNFVTRLALTMSGHNTPFTRDDLLCPAANQKS